MEAFNKWGIGTLYIFTDRSKLYALRECGPVWPEVCGATTTKVEERNMKIRVENL